MALELYFQALKRGLEVPDLPDWYTTITMAERFHVLPSVADEEPALWITRLAAVDAARGKQEANSG